MSLIGESFCFWRLSLVKKRISDLTVASLASGVSLALGDSSFNFVMVRRVGVDKVKIGPRMLLRFTY